MLKRLSRQILSVITVGAASTVLLIGCSDPRTLAGGDTGCERQFSGVTGVTRTETSKLSCAAINNLTSSMPSEPQAYLIRNDSPRFFWKCRFYGTEKGSVLLRCEHDKRHFSIVKGAS
jgi:hypothetical protein